MDHLLLQLDITGLIHHMVGSDTEDLNVLQMVVRAIITFLVALLLIRTAGIRSFGSKSAFDIVLSITMGAVLSRCISGHYSFIACIAAGTALAFMHRFLGLLSSNYSWFEKLINGAPDVLIQKNKMHHKNLKKNNLTLQDLRQAAHRDGIASLDDVEEAFFETNGKITLIQKNKTGAKA